MVMFGLHLPGGRQAAPIPPPIQARAAQHDGSLPVTDLPALLFIPSDPLGGVPYTQRQLPLLGLSPFV